MHLDKKSFDTAMSVILVAVAVAMLLQRLERDRSVRVLRAAAADSTIVSDWSSETEHAIRLGNGEAPLTIVEFMDFECSFCAAFATRLDSLRVEYPDEVDVTFFHYPLRNHRLALPAAIAAECSARQDRFERMYALLFKKQDSLGIKDWESYAYEADVGDLQAFQRCRKLPVDSFPRILGGKEIGVRLGIQSTPTVFVNGVRRGRGAPPLIDLRRRLLTARKQLEASVSSR